MKAPGRVGAATSAGVMSGGAPGGLVGLREAIAAELLRAKGSASARFSLFGLLVAVMQGLGWFSVATGPMRDWFGLLGWQSLYATGLMVPVVALLAAATTTREVKAREGGTWARTLAPSTGVVARLVVLAWQSLLLHAALTLPLLVFGLAGGLSQPPVGRFVAMWLVLWATSLLPLALGFVLSRRIGLIATVAMGLVWQLVGTVRAESVTWWAEPWAWPVRALLPILGIQQNGVRLDADSPVWSWNPVWPAALCLLAAALVGGLAAARARADASPRLGLARLGRRRRAGNVHDVVPARPAMPGAPVARPSAAAVVEVGRPRRFAAQAIILRATAIPLLLAAALAVFGLVAAVWSSDYVTGLAAWLAVPLGASILACLLWTANADGWRIAALRSSIRSLTAGILGWCAALLVVVVAAASVLAQLSSGPCVAPLFPVLLFATGAMTLAVSLLLATRFGTGAALAATLVVMIFSLVFGGTWISETSAWIAGIYGWPLTAQGSPARATLALAVSAVVTVAALAAWLGALRRAASGAGPAGA